MPQNDKNNKQSKPVTTVSPTVGDYEKHPFFVKKAEEAKALLQKVGLPEQLTAKVTN